MHLEDVLRLLREFGLKVHPGKCVCRAESIDFLGHHISVGSLQPLQDKLAAVRDLPSPTDVSSLRSALGVRAQCENCVLALNKQIHTNGEW